MKPAPDDPKHREPERTRRKLAEAYRRESENRRWKKGTRADFGHMAELWKCTLPESREKKGNRK